MAWYVNVILGFLIGSFMATYFPLYREGFKKVLNFLAKKTQTEPPKKKSKK